MDRLVLLALVATDGAPTSLASLQAWSGVARHTLLRGIRRLEAAGWLVVERKRAAPDAGRASNIYRVLDRTKRAA
jgi:predicted ArsR family transcriptional regulator